METIDKSMNTMRKPMKTMEQINENHGQKSMKTMGKSMNTMEIAEIFFKTMNKRSKSLTN